MSAGRLVPADWCRYCGYQYMIDGYGCPQRHGGKTTDDYWDAIAAAITAGTSVSTTGAEPERYQLVGPR